MRRPKTIAPSNEPAAISLVDRLEAGWFRPAEVWTLSGRGRSAFYRDAKAGLIKIHKIGTRQAGCWGPDVRRYIEAPLTESIKDAA